MSSAKKEAKAEANRQFVVSKMAGWEAEAKSYLKNKEAKYYSLKGSSINYHDEGVKNGFNEPHYEDYQVFPPDVDKSKQVEIKSELIRLVNSQRYSFSQLIDDVLARDNEDYWALLFWDAPEFKKLTKQYSKNDTQLSWKEERTAVKAITALALTVNVWYARDLVKLVINEFSHPYQYVLFNNSKEIAGDLHSQNKFKKNKKMCL